MAEMNRRLGVVGWTIYAGIRAAQFTALFMLAMLLLKLTGVA